MSVKVFHIKGYIKLALPYRLEARDNNLSHCLVNRLLYAYNAPTARQAATVGKQGQPQYRMVVK